MQLPISTLVLDAGGYGWQVVASRTIFAGLFRLAPGSRRPLGLDDGSVLGRFLIRRLASHYDSLGYARDWRDAICASPRLATRVVDINDLVALTAARRTIRESPLIIVTHLAAGDSMAVLNLTRRWFAGRRGKLAVFLGNEYDLLDAKVEFLRATRADFICSQLPVATARWLYAECERAGARVLPLAHALNPNVYRSATPDETRPIDVGFSGAFYPAFIGDSERTELIRWFGANGDRFGLKTEIPTGRLSRTDWAAFLDSCRATPGGEAGTYYLDLRGRLMAAAKEYERRHPGVTAAEVRDRVLERAGEVQVRSGKAISSRHFEAVGARTCQVLVDGQYNGILERDVHYISVARDLSNVTDAATRVGRAEERARVTDAAYRHVLAAHTYAHRVDALVDAVTAR